MDKIYNVIVIGAGQRGKNYSEHPRMNPIAVIEPRDDVRNTFATKYNISKNNCFTDIKQLPKCTDKSTVVFITTPDMLHIKCARITAKQGYKVVLMEKPMATNKKDCEEIVKLFKENDITCAVCHVLRATKANLAIKEYIPKLGKILSCRHLEPVGNKHFAHSFVRGNWRNEEESSNFLLAKCCHDLDLIHWWFGEDYEIESIYSTGDLSYFKKEMKPKEAGNVKKCIDCPLKNSCTYSAYKIYKPVPCWPTSVVCPPDTSKGPIIQSEYEKQVDIALKNGPYGRCVYECDNDVCDNQQVTIKYKNGPLIDFHSTATTAKTCKRVTEIYGSEGEIYSDNENSIVYKNFKDGTEQILNFSVKNSTLSGHGGADGLFVDDLIESFENGTEPKTNPSVTLWSHKMAFASEISRKEKKIVVNL